MSTPTVPSEAALRIGAALRAARKNVGMGPTAVSEALSMSLRTVYKHERGESTDLDKLGDYAALYETTVPALLAASAVVDIKG